MDEDQPIRKLKLMKTVAFWGILLRVIRNSQVIDYMPLKDLTEIITPIMLSRRGQPISPASLKGKCDKITPRELEKFIHWLERTLKECKAMREKSQNAKF